MFLLCYTVNQSIVIFLGIYILGLGFIIMQPLSIFGILTGIVGIIQNKNNRIVPILGLILNLSLWILKVYLYMQSNFFQVS